MARSRSARSQHSPGRMGFVRERRRPGRAADKAASSLTPEVAAESGVGRLVRGALIHLTCHCGRRRPIDAVGSREAPAFWRRARLQAPANCAARRQCKTCPPTRPSASSRVALIKRPITIANCALVAGRKRRIGRKHRRAFELGGRRLRPESGCGPRWPARLSRACKARHLRADESDRSEAKTMAAKRAIRSASRLGQTSRRSAGWINKLPGLAGRWRRQIN